MGEGGPVGESEILKSSNGRCESGLAKSSNGSGESGLTSNGGLGIEKPG